MARKKTTESKRPIETYEHTDKQRVNNPPVGLVTPDTDPDAGAKIINVQWDFDYSKRFSSTPGYSFVRGAKKEPQLQAQYEFPTEGENASPARCKTTWAGKDCGRRRLQ